MGNCTAKPGHSTQEESSILTIKPEEIQQLKNKKLPTLHYYFQLADIKLKKCEHPEIELKFKIGDFNQYIAPLKAKDQFDRIYWKISHSQSCDLTEYELSQKQLVIEAYNHKKQLKGSLAINLYLIWNGPCHLDFKFQLQKSKKTRISFNLKISQQIQLKIENIQTSLNCIQPIFPNDCFTFWLQSLISHQLQPSNHTYLLRIRQQAIHMKQNDSIQTYSASLNDITWKKQTPKEWILPQIQKTLFTHQIRYSTLHLTFFKVFPNNQNKNDPNFIILGSCFISLPKLINKDYKIIKDNKTNITYQQFQSTLSEKLWLHGKQVGKSIIRMKTTIQFHQKQMLTCVRTEKGIEISSPVFIGGEFSQSQQVSTLRKILDEVQNFILDLEQGQNERKSSTIKQIISNIISLLSRLLGLISRTSRQSAYCYQYTNQLQMIKAQRVMIDVAFKVLSYIRDQFHYDIQHICWQVLTSILKRDQFSLANIGFSRAQKQLLFMKKKNQIVDLKIQIGLKYQQLLYHLLQLTLNCLVVKGDQAQKTFAQSFCAYAYFRIPIFRQHILSVITKNNDPQITELKNLQGGGRQSNITKESEQLQKLYNGLFNWQQNFYSCIDHSTKFKSNQLFLSNILKKEHKWKERLQKRKGAFFTFLDNLIKKVQIIWPGNNFILWHSLPGYYQLVHAFLVEMKQMKLTEVNDRFKKCSLRLLSNQKLLNIFMIILLKKTNVYQSDTTLISLALLNQFFENQKSLERLICCTFDYKYFLIGLKGILESQYEYNISQVIVLIYNNFDYFSREFILELMLYLMSKYFFRFFFHWSFNLRKNFHTLIYVRLHRLDKKRTSSKKIENENKQPNSYYSFLKMFIQQRFQHLFQMIQVQMSIHTQQMVQDILDEKIIYKKMKLKLLKKVKDRNQNLKVIKQKPISFSPIFNTIRSSSQTLNGKMMIPRKKIFFENEELKLVPISSNQISYMKRAIAEYKALIQSIQKNQLITQDYEPQLKLKKILDQKEYGPMKFQEW